MATTSITLSTDAYIIHMAITVTTTARSRSHRVKQRVRDLERQRLNLFRDSPN
jgi:hypothetical protein